jgi:hypothetical protein
MALSRFENIDCGMEWNCVTVAPKASLDKKKSLSVGNKEGA